MEGNNPKDTYLHDHTRRGITSTESGTKRPLDVMLYDSHGGSPNSPYAMQTDEASPTVTYLAWALPGTLVTAFTWRIQRVTETSNDFSFEWCDGNANFDNQWSNRTSLSYS